MENVTMRIALLIDSRDMGGIETLVLQQAVMLCRGEHDTLNTEQKKSVSQTKIIFIVDYGEHPLEAKLKEHNISYTKLNGRLVSLIKTIRAGAFDVVHTHGYKAGILGRSVCSVLGVPVVSSFHAGESPKGVVKIYDLIDRYTAPIADHRLAASDEIAKRVFGTTQVIPNFINTENINPSTGKNIAYVGRLSFEKAPERMLDIAKGNPSHRFDVFGDGPLKKQLLALQNQRSVNNLIFHGFTNMDEKWNSIGLLLIPSRYEGLPLVALEAMARGIPVISTDVGDLSKLVAHGDDGWVVTLNWLDDFTHYINEWGNMKDRERSTMSENAIRKIESHYSFNAVEQSLTAIYHAIQ